MNIKKTLLYVIGVIAVIALVGLVASFLFALPALKNVRQLEERDKQTSLTNTEVSHVFNQDGTITDEPASNLVDLKINNSDQPLRTKAPFSFTLTWKISPKVDLISCDLRGPDSRGLNGGTWLSGSDGGIKAHEGSLEFKNVMPGDKTNEYGFSPAASLYNGFASFFYSDAKGSNVIYLYCDDPNTTENIVSVRDMVDVRIDR